MSGRVYQQHDWSKPYILRINQREETVEELFETPDRNIAVPGKKHFDQAHYRRACMNGEEHPLCIERHQYVMVTVCTQSIDAGIFMQADEPHEYSRSNRFSPLEMDFITSVQRRPVNGQLTIRLTAYTYRSTKTLQGTQHHFSLVCT